MKKQPKPCHEVFRMQWESTGCWVGKHRLLGRKAQVVVRKNFLEDFSPRPDNVVICCPILFAGLGQWWAYTIFYF